MTGFTSFILLAEMRTGSNFLEANLNMVDGVTCHGEAFNPSFVGYPKQDALLGMDRAAREADPHALLAAIQGSGDMAGFRFFHDHDPRILNDCLDDPQCAKIILTRNPIDSFISWKIAQSTGQWKLTNATHAKSQQITFEPEAFEAHLEATQSFQVRIHRALQTSGQSAFYIGYDDLRDLDVLNGLLQFLGVPGRLSNLNKKLKKQNPEPLSERVANFDEMQSMLRGLDRFDLGRTPNFEPKRGPAVPTYMATAKAGLLYIPLRSGPDAAVQDWLAAVDQVAPDQILAGFSQKSLRDWFADHPQHRSFAVLRHPLARAHAAFCDRILGDGQGSFPEIRANLRKVHKLPLPETPPDLTDPAYDISMHRAGFLGFLQFLRNNLAGQTSIRVDPSWASQLTLLQGIAGFTVPDTILREDMIGEALPRLAAHLGVTAPLPGPTDHPQTHLLRQINDAEIAKAARAAYARDYLFFGFEDWA